MTQYHDYNKLNLNILFNSILYFYEIQTIKIMLSKNKINNGEA